MAGCTVATSAAAAFKGATFNRARATRAQRLQLLCSAAQDHSAATQRRSVLLGLAGAAGAVVAAPFLGAAPAQAGEQLLPVASLSVLQKKGILQELEDRATEELKKVLTSADQADCVRLLLADAGTYDIATKTGGCDGSIVLPEELNRPENEGLKPIVEKLRKAKEAIDARRLEGQAPLSWADTIVLAAKVTSELDWREDKIAKAADPEKGAMIADGFGNAIRVRLGRIDATEPAPAGRLPGKDASLAEVQQFFFKLGAKPDQGGDGPFAKKPPFWERQQFLLWPAAQKDQAAAEAALAAFDDKYASWKKQYDISRTTVTRTSYEEDFGATLSLLANQGAKFAKDAYLAPIKVVVPDRF